jgi:TolB-like protein
MSFLPSRGLWCIAAAIVALSGFWAHVRASAPDSLFSPPLVARAVLPPPKGRCWGALDQPTLVERLARAADSTRSLRVDKSGTATLRLRMTAADGLCDLSLEIQDGSAQVSSRVTFPQEQPLSGSDALERGVAQLARSIAKERGGLLDIATVPSGATIRVDGWEAGVSPLRLEGLAPGARTLSFSLADWADAAETLQVQAGLEQSVSRTLERSSEWLEARRVADAAARRDSLWNAAHAAPASGLAELYDRLAAAVPHGSKVSVAILPFDVAGKRGGSYDPGVMAAEFGIARWSADPRFSVVERAAVSKLHAEQAFAQSGAASDSAAAGMGRLATAKLLVTGTVTDTDGRQAFTARLVDVETGSILSAAVSEKSAEDMDALYRDALGEKGQLSGAVYRSLVGPGWGQFYTGHPVHGSVALLGVLGSIGFATWAYLDYADKDDVLQKFRKHDPATARKGESLDDWIERAETARAEYNDASTMFGVSLGVVGGAWLLNVVDAAILGHLESTRVKARYYACIPVPVVRPEGLALAWRF